MGSVQGVSAKPGALLLVLFRVFCSISGVLLKLHVGLLLWHDCDAAIADFISARGFCSHQ